MSVLRIYFSDSWKDASSVCSWALCDETGTVLKSGTDMLSDLPQGHDCIAIAAADRVLLLDAALPAGPRRRWQGALPFVVEERTVSDPEDNHVVPGPLLSNGRIAIAVMDKAWLRRITEACHAAGLSLRRMVAETLLPECSADKWTMVWNGANGFVRSGTATGMALDNGNQQRTPIALRLTSVPTHIEVRLSPTTDVAPALPQWTDLPTALIPGPAWDWRLAPIPADAWNLLWGEFAPRARIREWWPKLRPAAWIVLAVLGIEILGTHVQWALLANEKSRLEHNMTQSFRAAFGQEAVLVNAPVQMQRNLAELRHATGRVDDGDLLPLLDTAAPVLTAMPGLNLQALHYESGRLDLDIKAARRNDVHLLQKRLQDKGLTVRVGNIHEAGNQAETRLSITIGGGL